MGLEGYLEDLGISEILQIVSLSKKSGILTLKSPQGEGQICFAEGQVVRAVSSEFLESLGELLCKEKLATEEQIQQALAEQKKLTTHQPLGALLVDRFQVPRASIETVVKRQIEKIVFRFIRWTSGTFSFRIAPPQSFGTTAVNPLDFLLEKGISPQWLVAKEQQINEQGETEVSEADLEREVKHQTGRQGVQDLAFLKGMLAELENPFLGGGIILLILRYASEIMSRAVIFDVRGRQLVGLGQFGLSGQTRAADQIVRQMRLTVEEGSAFAKVLQDQTALRTSLADTSAERILSAFLEGVPDEVFLGPLVNDGKVIALLYGDNYPQQMTLGSTEAFEVFLSQAGLAMEQALQP
jgi:hypothetical protein